MGVARQHQCRKRPDQGGAGGVYDQRAPWKPLAEAPGNDAGYREAHHAAHRAAERHGDHMNERDAHWAGAETWLDAAAASWLRW
jgi:hypothetical protein